MNDSSEIYNRQQELDDFMFKYFGPDEPVRIPLETINTHREMMPDDELIKKIEMSKQGDHFQGLFNGDLSDYPSQSEADLAFCNSLAFWSGKNNVQMDRIFRKSSLMRAKWDEKHGAQTYGEMTINKAIAGCVEAYGDTQGVMLPNIEKMVYNIFQNSNLKNKNVSWAPKNPIDNQKSDGPLNIPKVLRFSPISTVEWEYSRLHPDSIVDNYLYADVGILIAPGGVGKTTLVIYEAICVSLGIPLYGRTIKKPGKVLLISAEDSREQIIARLARIAESMNLFPEQIEYISNNILIDYVGGEDFRLCKVVGDVVTNSQRVEEIIEAIKPLNPSLLVIDPAVSFGVGESRVNDAEQGLIQAARRIRDSVGCCVRLVHHTGKQNAREKTTDQYSGRGGSAMADGARMVAVLQRMNADEWFQNTGEPLPDNATGLLLALPKMSYAPAQRNIFIERIDFKYRHVEPTVLTAEDKRAVIDSQVIEFLHSEEMQGRYHSKSSLEKCEALGVTRKETRDAIERLEVAGCIVMTKKQGTGQGQYIKLVNYSPEPMASNRQFPDQLV